MFEVWKCGKRKWSSVFLGGAGLLLRHVLGDKLANLRVQVTQVPSDDARLVDSRVESKAKRGPVAEQVIGHGVPDPGSEEESSHGSGVVNKRTRFPEAGKLRDTSGQVGPAVRDPDADVGELTLAARVPRPGLGDELATADARHVDADAEDGESRQRRQHGDLVPPDEAVEEGHDADDQGGEPLPLPREQIVDGRQELAKVGQRFLRLLETGDVHFLHIGRHFSSGSKHGFSYKLCEFQRVINLRQS